MLTNYNSKVEEHNETETFCDTRQ